MVKFGIYKAAKMKLLHQSVLWLSQSVGFGEGAECEEEAELKALQNNTILASFS